MAKKGMGAAGASVLNRNRTPITPGITPERATTDSEPIAATTGIVAALRSDTGGGGAGVLEIPIAEVAEHPDNPRDQLGNLDGLAGSITAMGLLQPILVTPAADFVNQFPEHADTIGHARWVVSAGHRRRAASLAAGLSTIAAIVRPQGDRIASYVTFIDENVHRANLEPLEEARGYSLLSDAGLSQRDIAGRLRVSQAQVSKRLALLKLPQQVQDAIATGAVSVADALSLTGVPVEDQLSVWELAQRERLLLSSAVERVERRRADLLALEKARATADKAGDQLIDDPRHEWNDPYRHRLHSEAEVKKARKAGTLRAHATTHGLIHYTTDAPVRGTNDSGGDVDDTERRKAMKARVVAAGQLVATPPDRAEATRALTRITLVGSLAYADCLRLTHKWLGEQCGTAGLSDMYAWRDSIQSASEATQLWVAWAMTIAADEQSARGTYLPWGPRTRDYLDLLIHRTGYQPTAWEAARLHSIQEDES